MIKSFINYIRQSDLIYTILIVLFVILVSTVIIKLFTSAIDYDNSPVAKKRQMIDNFFNQCIADAPQPLTNNKRNEYIELTAKLKEKVYNSSF